MRAGQKVRLDIAAWDKPTVADQSALYVTVSGIVVGDRRHQDDGSRVLYYFRTLRVERSVDAVAATAEKNNTFHPHRDKREGLSVGVHTITSACGFKYSFDGWYDEIFLYRIDDDDDNNNNSNTSTNACGNDKPNSEVTIPREWRTEMERDTSPCELLYLSYATRPWFYSPFSALQYLHMPDRHLCYSVSLCHRCLQPFFSRATFAEHLAGYCTLRRPPGLLLYHDPETDRKVYCVDGAAQLHYARCLALIGKCFLESKILVSDVDINEFFVVTSPRRSLPYVPGEMDEASFRREAAQYDEDDWDGDVFAGYFTRVKRCPDHCLNCIVTLPMFQQQGLGFFMLDMAYALTAMRQRLCGCDAACGRSGGNISRPFSPQGQALFLAYWRRRVTAALVAAGAVRGTVEKEPKAEPFAALHAKILSKGFPIFEEDLRFFALNDERCFYARAEQEVVEPATGQRGTKRTGDEALGVQGPKASGLIGSLILFKGDAATTQRKGAFDKRFWLSDLYGHHLYCPKLFHY